MALRVLTKTAEIAAASKAFADQIEGGKPFERTLGHQGGSAETTVYWHGRAGVWGVQERGSNRFWQVFGLKRPDTWQRSPIVVEINPPFSGIDRRTGGVFLTNERAMFLGHRGTHINQVSMADFEKHFREGSAGRWVRVVDGQRETDVILLGRVDRRQVIRSVAAFAQEVRRIKKRVRPGMTSTG